MKNIIYTLWTKPLIKNNLYDNIVYLLLSVELVKQFADTICIYTDNYGKEILTKFNLDVKINTNIINKLDNLDIKRWSIPKLYTIKNQNKPYCHIDHDVFLWEKPNIKNNYQVITQNIENGDFFGNIYKKSFNNYINNNSTILDDFVNYSDTNIFGGFNCGYIDMYDMDISKQWSNLSLNLNDTFINNFTWDDCILIEQFTLFYLYKKYNLNIGELLKVDYNYDNYKSNNIKYTHLMRSKKSKEILYKVEQNIYKLNLKLYNKLLINKNFFLNI